MQERARKTLGIAFDLDDTLYSRQGAFASFIAAECRKAPNHTLDAGVLAELDRQGYGDKQPLLAYLGQSFGWPESDHESRYARFRTGQIENLPIDAALEPLLARLSRHYRLALLSNGRSAMQRGKLEKLRIARYFDPILISEELATKKPARAFFEPLLQAWSIPAEQIVMVGDHPRFDILGARALGIEGIWVSRGRAWPLAERAPPSVTSVFELEPLLAARHGPSCRLLPSRSVDFDHCAASRDDVCR